MSIIAIAIRAMAMVGLGLRYPHKLQLIFRDFPVSFRGEFLLLGPLNPAMAVGKNPKGGAHDVRRFRKGQEPRPKMPTDLADPALSAGRIAGVCLTSHSAVEKHFFWLLFFAQAKKRFSTAEWLVKVARATARNACA